MYVYQEDVDYIGLSLGLVLNQNDMDEIIGHNPLSIEVDPLWINISFCEPSKPVSFDPNRRIYSVSLCFRELSFLKNGNSLVAIHVIEEVRFILDIFFVENSQSFNGRPTKRAKSYLLLNGSTVG